MQLIATRKYLSQAKESRNIFSFGGGINTCMKTYIATVRIHGRLMRTRVWADDPVHARLLLQYFFGMSSIAVGPVLGEGDLRHLPNAEELRLKEAGIAGIKPVTPSKPRTPGQAQIAALKTRIDQAKQALQAERQRQKMIKAQRSLQAAMQPNFPK